MNTMSAARGRWQGILTHFGLEPKYLQSRHGPCPFCGGRDRFRWTNKDGEGNYICNQCGLGDGMDLLMRLKGWDFQTAASEVDRIVGTVRQNVVPIKRNNRPMIESVRRQLEPVSLGVRAYLAGRGLRPTQNLRSAILPYYEAGLATGEYECMVGGIQSPDGDLETFHITYLQDGKKAPVQSPRKILPPINTINAGAIRLTKRYPEIGIAEGIETALAVMLDFDIPCWSVVSAGQMETFAPPRGIESVRIFADSDLSYTGQKSAFVLASRLVKEGYRVKVELPPEGRDFADLREAANGG